ncbi:MAG: Gfo/Idh/MocA family oxidoreductase [Caldilineaceae bacterium]|nr:Gfo/Idh/MocA family oxidoreductase [Caldilineaceae bacterium]
MATALRWGVLSTANIGRAAVIPAIQQSHNGEMVAVASRTIAAAQEFAGRMNIPRYFGSYEALLASDEVDAVYIPLPNSLHKEWSIRTAQAGKHILCEKPLALTAAECEEMAAAAAANGVYLMEAFMYRFHPRIVRVQELLDANAIGAQRFIYATFTFRLTDEKNIRFQSNLGGGALMDVGCYCVNAARTLAGREPCQVQANAVWHKTGVDSRLAGLLDFGDGLIAQFDCALTMARREAFQVAGDDGYLEVADAFLPGTKDVIIVERHGRDAPIVHPVTGVDEYRRMVEHFSDSVLHQRPLQYDAAEAAANMRVIEALYRSARNGGAPTMV